MALSCDKKCTKGGLLSLNVLLWLLGCIQVLVGVCIIMDTGKVHLYYSMIADIASVNSVSYIAYLICVVGAAVIVIGLVGCCAVVKDQRPLLTTYFICLVALIASNLSVSIGTAFYRQHILTGLSERLYKQLINQYGYPNKDLPHPSETHIFTQAMDFAQYSFNCCGIYNDADYMQSKWRNRSTSINEPKNVPSSCCVLPNKHDVSITRSPISAVSTVFHGFEKPWQNPQPKNGKACQSNEDEGHLDYRYKQGCFHFIDNWFKMESNFIVFLCLASALLQILGILTTIFVCRNLNQEDT